MGDLFLGRTGSLRNGWRAFFFYVCASAGYGLILWACPGIRNWPRSAYPLGLFAALFLCSWLFVALEARPLQSLGLRLGGAFAGEFALGLLAGFLLMAGTALAVLAAGGVHLAPARSPWVLASGLLVYLVPAVNEELAFRGYLFQRLERSLGTRACLTLMAVLFAAAHGRNPGLGGPGAYLSLLNLFLAGLLLGLAYVRTRSLALSMGLHLAWNWTQGALLGFQVSGTASQGLFQPVLLGRPDWLTGGAFGLEGSLPCAVLCGAFCLLLASRKQNSPVHSI